MLKKILKRTLQILLVFFIVIQFIRPAKNNTPGISKDDISTLYPLPDSVHAILKTSCYDCHSNNTSYPWYSRIQPVAWWLDSHIQDGKKDLNFSEFVTYSIRRQYIKLQQVHDLVKKDEMPLDSYLWIHKYAKLSEQQKNILTNWVSAIRDTIKANYPADSLVRKNKS